MDPHASASDRIVLLLTFAALALPAGCGSSGGDDDDGAPDAGVSADGGDGVDAAADDGGGGDLDAGHEGLLAYGREWLTPEERDARRAAERLDLAWDFEEKIACGAFMIYATATLDQIDEICGVAESLYRAYADFFAADLELPAEHDDLRVRLFGTRDEFRDVVLGGQGWAEGLYDGEYCNMYYDGDSANPYHWFVHEATHQLNYEVAGLNNVQWLEEGMACYFGTSVVLDGELQLGVPDIETYPVWWMPSWDVRDAHIPLSTIVSGQGGPDMDQYFNDYYLHWWTLVHFLVQADDGAYRDGLIQMLDRRLRLVDFEAEVGDIDAIEAQWIDYVAALEY